MEYSFVSGATGGIGKAFVKELAKREENLFLTGRSIEKLNELKEELSSYKVDVIVCACDLTDRESRESMYSYIEGLKIRFNRIVNVAGVDTQMGFREYTEDKMLFQLRVNCEGTLSLTRNLLSKMDKGEIITISSMSGVSPMPYFQIYSATKAMLTNFFTSLHYELKKSGIKVTTVLPGGVYTRPDLIEEIKTQGLWGKLSAKTPEFVAKKSLKAVKKNKIIYVVGFFNKFLYCLMKIAPKRIVLSFIARRWKTHKKDAFK